MVEQMAILYISEGLIAVRVVVSNMEVGSLKAETIRHIEPCVFRSHDLYV